MEVPHFRVASIAEAVAPVPQLFHRNKSPVVTDDLYRDRRICQPRSVRRTYSSINRDRNVAPSFDVAPEPLTPYSGRFYAQVLIPQYFARDFPGIPMLTIVKSVVSETAQKKMGGEWVPEQTGRNHSWLPVI